MSITLENVGPRTLTVELSHDVVCLAGTCGCISQAVGKVTYGTHAEQDAVNKARAEASSGRRLAGRNVSLQAQLKSFPRVLTLRARGLEGSSISGLPEAVSELLTVKRNPDLRTRPDVLPQSSATAAPAPAPAAGGEE